MSENVDKLNPSPKHRLRYLMLAIYGSKKHGMKETFRAAIGVSGGNLHDWLNEEKASIPSFEKLSVIRG